MINNRTSLPFLLVSIFLAALAAGCSSPRHSRYDEFEKLKVDKMVANEVRFHWLSRSIVCLNAMREARWPEPVTNITVNLLTNVVVSYITNLTIVASSNEQLGSNTNVTALPPSLAKADSIETNNVIAPAGTPLDAAFGGVTVSVLRNESRSFAPNQSVFSQVVQRTTLLNQQGTINSNNLAVTAGTNQTITVETNLVVTTLTNQVVTPVTNVTVLSPDQQTFDYYLYTELAPPDFTLQPGESLIVLVDGERHAFAPSQPQSAWTNRRGYATTFYKVPAEVVVGIANAEEVKIRIRGVNGVLERKLSGGSLQNFREFLIGNFGPEKATVRLKAPKETRS